MNIRTSAFRGLAILSLSVLGLAACDEKDPVTPVPVPEVTVTVTPASLDLEVGQTGDLVAIVGNSTNQAVTWSTSNAAVATVSATGRVTAVAPGGAVITATSAADGTKRAAAGVTVRAAPPVVLTVQPTAATLNVGGTVQLVPNVTGTTNTAVTYTTSAANVATVSTAGVVTAVGAGTAIITTRSAADNTKVATTQITVLTPPSVTVSVTPSQATVDVGGTVQFVSTVTGSTNTAVTWTSSQPGVATITASGGLATAVGSGTTVITATSAADPTKVATAVLTVSALPPVVISATPQNVSINPGSNQNVTVGISGGNNAAAQGFTASTSDASIATVTVVNGTTARISGVASGTATITLTSVADPSKSTAVTVTVASVTQPSISIQSVTTPGGVPIAPGTAVAGVINVNMNVTAGSQTNISAVEVRLNGVVACTQTFSPPLAPTQGVATISCPINTAALNADGTATWPNGTYSLTAHALNGASVVASATYGNLIFANANVIAATISTTGAQAIGGAQSIRAGQQWNEGDVVVNAVATMYAGGNVGSVTVCLNADGLAVPTANMASAAFVAGTICRTAAAPVAGTTNTFQVTFPKASAATAAAGGSAGLEAASVSAGITSLTVAGGVGPASTSNRIHLDNLAPVVTAFQIVPNAYINGAYLFTSTAGCDAAPATAAGSVAPCYSMNDLGSDTPTVVYNVQTTGGATVTGGANVTNVSGADIAETATSTERIVQAVVTDLTGNTRTVYATVAGAAPSTTVAGAARFGIDKTAPTITVAAGPANLSANPRLAGPAYNNTYNFTFVDAGTGPSGFGATPLRIRVEQFVPAQDGTSATRTCIDRLSGAQLAGTAGTCGGATGGYVTTADDAGGAGVDVTLPMAGADAYWQVTAEVRDFAGNTSTQVTRITMDDEGFPVIGFIVGPTIITGGASATFSAQMQDNVELGDQLGYIGYNEPATIGGLWLVTQRDVLGTYGFDVMTTPITSTHTIASFIRSVETTAAGAPSGVISRATDMNLAVRDMSGSQNNVACTAAGTEPSTAGGALALGNCTTATNNILPAVSLGMNSAAETSWSAAGRPFGTTVGAGNQNYGGTAFTNTSSAAAVCSNIPVGAGSGCAVVTATTKTLTATATGPAQTFANPFQRVNFYYTDGLGRSYLIGTGSVTVTDNTVTATRTWTYTVSWNPGAMGVVAGAGPAAGAYPVFALGVDAQGRALMSNAVNVPVTSD